MTLLLDTHALIWLVEGIELRREARDSVDQAAADAALYVSVASAWEIGLLASKHGLDFAPSPQDWFAAVLAKPGVRLAEISYAIAIESWTLPGQLHRDPADRLLVATARRQAMRLMTRDRRLARYAAAGHLEVVRC